MSRKLDGMTEAPDTPEDRPPGIPRWVKFSGAAVLVVVVVLVVSALAGVDHGPQRHMGDDSTSAPVHTGPPPGVTHGEPE